MKKPETYASVWNAIADTPERAANLRSRAELMQKIAERVKRHGWTQAEPPATAASPQPRINDPLRGRVYRFSLDIATALGCVCVLIWMPRKSLAGCSKNTSLARQHVSRAEASRSTN